MEETFFVVRKAVEEDIPEIQRITREAFRAYAESAGIKGTIDALEETCEDVKRDIETKEVFVALLNGSVVGSVRVEVRPDNTAYLSRLGVMPANHNYGIGKALMDAVDSTMMRLGVSNLYLHTASRLLPLVRFYYGRGFYIESTATDCGYIRALLCKEYEVKTAVDVSTLYESCAAL